MQSWHKPVSTEKKVAYINQLLRVGFDTIDFGSFVSPKAIPQMADTKEVLKGLDLSGTKSSLLAIVANIRGAREALVYDEIHYLGFPFSVSETFQKRNTNSSMQESLTRVDEIQNLCRQSGKELVLYISMGFGNPYGDTYHPDIVIKWIDELMKLEIKIFPISDTVGVSNPQNIGELFDALHQAFGDKDIEFGAHFHSTPDTRVEKLEAAFAHHCSRLDSALRGIGGCPMAQDDLVGNMATETIVDFLEEKQIILHLDQEAFQKAQLMATEIFI